MLTPHNALRKAGIEARDKLVVNSWWPDGRRFLKSATFVEKAAPTKKMKIFGTVLKSLSAQILSFQVFRRNVDLSQPANCTAQETNS